MNLHLDKKSILKKTVQVGAATLLSRVVAIAREVLQVKFFGVGALSDAFIVAFRLPNLFRHVFAEGALSASFVPVFVKTVKQGQRDDANGLMSALFFLIQSFIFALYAVILLKGDWVVACIAPGFSAEQAVYTELFLKILFPFLAFVSASALLGGALNAVNNFFIPAVGPALWNITYVATLMVCVVWQLPPTYLCIGVLLGGAVQFLLNIVAYFNQKFSFGPVTQASKLLFKEVMTKFLPCLLGVSIIEINLFVSGVVASYLPQGSVSLLYYGSRFMNIPLGVFGVALSGILLPHFSRVVLYAPKRFNFYLLEVAKFVTWVILPISLLFMFISEELFAMIFLLAKKISPEHVVQAKWILVIYCAGLVFFCFNKVLLSLFYSLKDTRSTTIASGIGAMINMGGDLISLYYGSVYGIAASAVAAGLGMSLVSCYFLHKQHSFRIYWESYLIFLGRFAGQLACGVSLFLGLYYGVGYCSAGTALMPLLTSILGYWLLVGACGGVTAVWFYLTRKIFRVNAYFLKG